MSITASTPRKRTDAIGNTKPGRSKHVEKVVVDADTNTGWIDVRGFGLITIAWLAAHAALTATVQGRFIDDAGNAVGEHIIGDKDAAPIAIDLTLASSFPLDVAATVDEIKVTFPSLTDDFYISMGG